jgi:hypothetical protein
VKQSTAWRGEGAYPLHFAKLGQLLLGFFELQLLLQRGNTGSLKGRNDGLGGCNLLAGNFHFALCSIDAVGVRRWHARLHGRRSKVPRQVRRTVNEKKCMPQTQLKFRGVMAVFSAEEL